MPRKQRFKPSRKPKPMPQNEDAVAREASSAPARGGSMDLPDSAPNSNDSSVVEPDPDDRSR
jgi:hypothetical protein